MPEPCEQKDTIEEIRTNHSALHAKTHEMDKKIDILIENQSKQQEAMTKFFARLEEILVADVENRNQIVQLQKEHDIIFEKLRAAHEAHDRVVAFMTECNALEIKEKTKQLWDDRTAYTGVKKWKAEIYTILGAIATAFGVLTYLGMW